MFRKVVFSAVMAAACLAAAPAPARAQASDPSAQALGRCLELKTSGADREFLVQWIFLTISRHPSIAKYTNLSAEEATNVNRRMGALFTRLLADDCPNETRAVFAQGNPEKAMQVAFETLGRTATMGLMGQPEVSASASEMGKFIDEDRLVRALAGGRP